MLWLPMSLGTEYKIGGPRNTSGREACDERIGGLVSWCLHGSDFFIFASTLCCGCPYGLFVGTDRPSVLAQSDPRGYVTKWNPPETSVSADVLCVCDIVILCFIWLSVVVGGLSDETCRPSLCTCHKKTFSRMEREGILKPSMAAMDCLLDLAVFLEQK
jgi:hypothetical protein